MSGSNYNVSDNDFFSDVASKERDQTTLSEWKESVPPTLRYLLRTDVNERHPVVPLGVSGHNRIPKSILNQAIIEQNLRLETDNYDSTPESEQEESSDSPWGWKKCPPGLQESVCTKLKALNITQIQPLLSESQNGTGKIVMDLPQLLVQADTNGHENGCTNHDPSVPKPLPNGFTPKTKNVDLSLMVEVRTRCQRKPEAMYTFMCSREFRRDEYPNHFSHIHSKIHTQLNGWLFTRCPMSNLGCGFGVERMQPVDENYNVIYNHAADAFCFTQQTSNSLDAIKSQCMTQSHQVTYIWWFDFFSKFWVQFNVSFNFLDVAQHVTEKTDTQKVSLSSLPFELLVHLTKFLDPLR